MKGSIGLATLVLVALAGPAAAQQPAASLDEAVRSVEQEIRGPGGVVEALDSIGAAASPELGEALERLAVALSGVATRLAEDPELRASAARAAQGLVGVAQLVVAEQSRVLQEVLREVSEQIPAPAAPPAPPEPARTPR